MKPFWTKLKQRSRLARVNMFTDNEVFFNELTSKLRELEERLEELEQADRYPDKEDEEMEDRVAALETDNDELKGGLDVTEQHVRELQRAIVSIRDAFSSSADDMQDMRVRS